MAIRNNPCKAELKTARRQLQSMLVKLNKMSCQWDGLSGWLETESERLAENVDQHLKALDEQIDEWQTEPVTGNNAEKKVRIYPGFRLVFLGRTSSEGYNGVGA